MITVSVVMPTHNTPVPFLREAVDSILNQTFQDFEFIIIDDHSTDGSEGYLASLSDPRIRIIRNREQLGVTKSLNEGLRAARGLYIARMDSDDISLPGRFAEQVAFMKSHPDVIACGTGFSFFGASNGVYPGKDEDMAQYRVRMLFVNPGPSHPSAFLDRGKLEKHHIQYNENLPYAQDYDLWTELCRYGEIRTLPDVLLMRRKHDRQVTRQHRQEQIQCDKTTQRKLLEELLGQVTEAELDMHFTHSPECDPAATISDEIAAWYARLVKANDRRGIYDKKTLRRYVEWRKRSLIEQTFTPETGGMEKMRLYFRYLSLDHAARAVAGACRRRIRRLLRGYGSAGEDRNVP